MLFALLTTILFAALANAHLAAWHKGMYCLDGNIGSVDLNAAAPTTPLYMLPKSLWWFHHVNGCDNFPPKSGDFLELPAGKDFTVEISDNRATTSLSYNGRYSTDWVDGKDYPEDYNVPNCITTPNMHTQNRTMAAGTAFAISYQSDIKKVTAENLVVFSVRYHTPWLRVTSYSVPAAMPACPPGGCICAWGWIPNGCGEPNMYHQAFKCKVTAATAMAPVAVAQPPVWCEDDPSKCTKGAKQMIYWNQLDGNNIKVSGFDRAGMHKSPAYNSKCGFPDGAQNDIFAAPSAGGGNGNTGPASDSSSGSGAGSNSGSPSSGAGSTGGSPPSNPPSGSTGASPPSNPPSGSTVPVPVSSPVPAPSQSPSAPAPASSSPPPSPSTGGGTGECSARRRRRRRSTTPTPGSKKMKKRAGARARHSHRRRRLQAW
ncbi:hypothetical protein D9615_002077 [Tricholomella constricta]|uniref:Uncharacterized protein n=1 Tax=Tricholomella constricta TaxID=117010 RepID=A0A8H5HNP8_9AGAR|nr:hypothetical protein D9615_002077 [Tricholomella constricta]